jgi:hypothetical protein
MNIIIRKFYDTAKRNVWVFTNDQGEIVNRKGEISMYGGGWSTRKEAQIVARSNLRDGLFKSVRYEYQGRDSDGVSCVQLKSLS